VYKRKTRKSKLNDSFLYNKIFPTTLDSIVTLLAANLNTKPSLSINISHHHKHALAAPSCSGSSSTIANLTIN
jgi:hypothetical protein